MKKIYLIIFLLILLLNNFSCKSNHKKNEVNEGIIFEGKVRLVGNDPFSRLVIKTKDGKNYYLPDELIKEYPALFGRMIKIKGKIEVKEVISADFKHRRKEYHLTDVKIIR